MSVPIYFDHNAPRPVALGLRQRDVDVLTALQDGPARLLNTTRRGPEGPRPCIMPWV